MQVNNSRWFTVSNFTDINSLTTNYNMFIPFYYHILTCQKSTCQNVLDKNKKYMTAFDLKWQITPI